MQPILPVGIPEEGADRQEQADPPHQARGIERATAQTMKTTVMYGSFMAPLPRLCDVPGP